MAYGYSIKLLEANRDADGSHLGVQLGRLCIRRGIPVSEVAKALGVTRQTVYNWFCGAAAPQDGSALLISEYIEQLRR